MVAFPTKRQAQAWAIGEESEASRLRSGGLPEKQWATC